MLGLHRRQFLPTRLKLHGWSVLSDPQEGTMSYIPPLAARLALPNGVLLPDRALSSGEARHFLQAMKDHCYDEIMDDLDETVEGKPEDTLLAALAESFDRRMGIEAPDEVMDLLELAIGIVDVIRAARAKGAA